MRDAREWVIDLGRLPVISLNSRMHWSEKKRSQDEWKAAVYYLAKEAQTPGLSRARVQLIYVAPDRRRRDEDNLAPCSKVAVDALVLAGVLPDDSPEYIDHMMPRIVHEGERGTFQLRITELDA